MIITSFSVGSNAPPLGVRSLALHMRSERVRGTVRTTGGPHVWAARAVARRGSFGTGRVPCAPGLVSSLVLVFWAAWRVCRAMAFAPLRGAAPAL